MKILQRELNLGSYTYLPACGLPTDQSWLPETSFFVLNLQSRDAMAIAKRHDQAAYVQVVLGGPPELVYT